MKTSSLLMFLALAGLMPGLRAAESRQDGAVAAHPPALVPAVRVQHAAQAGMLCAARAGSRIVAAGDHGVVLLSDDGARSPRQAKSVPVDVTLTSVSFVDEKQGWAVGHWGVVLHTVDGGDTWEVQRSDVTQDRPLFAVHFSDPRHGVAVGLWSIVLVTEDGGKNWQTVNVPIPEGAKKADLNLLGLFADEKGRLYAAAEKGMVLRSDDGGNRWSYMPTGYAGSFWTGLATPNGALLVAGLRGSLYRSVDDGLTWVRIDTHTKSSITTLLVAGPQIIGVGLDGLVLRSIDEGATFVPEVRADRLPLTAAAVDSKGAVILYSAQGVVVPEVAAASQK